MDGGIDVEGTFSLTGAVEYDDDDDDGGGVFVGVAFDFAELAATIFETLAFDGFAMLLLFDCCCCACCGFGLFVALKAPTGRATAVVVIIAVAVATLFDVTTVFVPFASFGNAGLRAIMSGRRFVG